MTKIKAVNKIGIGQYRVVKCGIYGYTKTKESEKLEKELIRLAKLGLEAEDACKRCPCYIDEFVCQDQDCGFSFICKTTRDKRKEDENE